MPEVNTSKTSYIPSNPEAAKAYPITPAQAHLLEQWGSASPHDPAGILAFGPHESTHEQTTPRERSIALIIRLIPFTVLWFILSLAVVWLFAVDHAVGYLLFAVLTAFTYYLMDRSEREFSTNGLERHRINVAASLAREKLRTDAYLRREVVQAHLKLLERHNEEYR